MATKETKATAWWTSNSKGVLRFGDKRVAKPGITHTVPKKDVKLGEKGLHAWATLRSCLHNMESDTLIGHRMLWKVELLSPETETGSWGTDKMVSHSRKYIYKVENPIIVLRQFAFNKTLDLIDNEGVELPDILLDYLEDPSATKHTSMKEIRREVVNKGYYHGRSGSGASSVVVAGRILTCIPKLAREEFPTIESLLDLIDFCCTETLPEAPSYNATEEQSKHFEKELNKLFKKTQNKHQKLIVKTILSNKGWIARESAQSEHAAKVKDIKDKFYKDLEKYLEKASF